MSMTKSRARADRERWEAAERERQAKLRPILEARRAFKERFPVIVEIRCQIATIKQSSGYVPHIIWLGRKHHERWLLEMRDMHDGSFVPMDFDCIPVRRKACPGVSVTPRLNDRWERIIADHEKHKARHAGRRQYPRNVEP